METTEKNTQNQRLGTLKKQTSSQTQTNLIKREKTEFQIK